MMDAMWIVEQSEKPIEEMTKEEQNQLQSYIAGAVFNMTRSAEFMERALIAVSCISAIQTMLLILLLLRW